MAEVLPSVSWLERTCHEHGYNITVKVKESGQALVTLKDTFTGAIFEGNSGDNIGAQRYDVALNIAVQRMLDYQFRKKPGERPEYTR